MGVSEYCHSNSSLRYGPACCRLRRAPVARAQALPQLQAKLRIERARMRLRILAPLSAKPELDHLLDAQGAAVEYQDLGLSGQQARAPDACLPYPDPSRAGRQRARAPCMQAARRRWAARAGAGRGGAGAAGFRGAGACRGGSGCGRHARHTLHLRDAAQPMCCHARSVRCP